MGWTQSTSRLQFTNTNAINWLTYSMHTEQSPMQRPILTDSIWTTNSPAMTLVCLRQLNPYSFFATLLFRIRQSSIQLCDHNRLFTICFVYFPESKQKMISGVSKSNTTRALIKKAVLSQWGPRDTPWKFSGLPGYAHGYNFYSFLGYI